MGLTHAEEDVQQSLLRCGLCRIACRGKAEVYNVYSGNVLNSGPVLSQHHMQLDPEAGDKKME